MNCTRQEFEKIVRSKYPHKYMCAETNYYGAVIVFALDTQGECQQSYASKSNLASHIWVEGQGVVIDSDGLFASLPPTIQPFTSGNGTYTIPIPPPTKPYKYTVHGHMVGGGGNYSGRTTDQQKLDKEYAITLKKCECGAHKVNSNKHSSWCQIKENA